MNKAVWMNSGLSFRQQPLFSVLCRDAGECMWVVTDSWKATRVWSMGHWLLLLLSVAVHAGTASSGCLAPQPLVGWVDGAGILQKRQVRDWEEKRRRQTVFWWLGDKVLQPSIKKKLFSEVWEVWMCHTVRMGACVFSFQQRGLVCSIDLACAFRKLVCVCV